MATCKDCLHAEVCYYKTFNDVRSLENRRNDVEKICKSFLGETKPKRGRWDWNGKHWECSNCRRDRLHDLVLGLDAAYCPYCGADMKEESK